MFVIHISWCIPQQFLVLVSVAGGGQNGLSKAARVLCAEMQTRSGLLTPLNAPTPAHLSHVDRVIMGEVRGTDNCGAGKTMCVVAFEGPRCCNRMASCEPLWGPRFVWAAVQARGQCGPGVVAHGAAALEGTGKLERGLQLPERWWNDGVELLAT